MLRTRINALCLPFMLFYLEIKEFGGITSKYFSLSQLVVAVNCRAELPIDSLQKSCHVQSAIFYWKQMVTVMFCTGCFLTHDHCKYVCVTVGHTEHV